MGSRQSGIPHIPQTDNQELHRFLIAVKEYIEVAQGTRGTYKDRVVTVGMLVSLGIITDAQAQNIPKV